MAEASSQLLSDVGRPRPNFQRLIEYVEPVEEEDVGAASLRIPSPIQMAKFTILRWKSRSSMLKLSPNTSHRQPCSLNYSLRRRPKFMDIRLTGPSLGESSAEMTKSMNNKAESKPIVKIKPKIRENTSAPCFDFQDLKCEK